MCCLSVLQNLFRMSKSVYVRIYCIFIIVLHCIYFVINETKIHCNDFDLMPAAW